MGSVGCTYKMHSKLCDGYDGGYEACKLVGMLLGFQEDLICMLVCGNRCLFSLYFMIITG